MTKILYKTISIGFIFGIVFSVIAYFTNLLVQPWLNFLIPFLSGILSGLGALIASLMDRILVNYSIKHRHIIGFIVAAIVNVSIVFIMIGSFNKTLPTREMLFGVIFGLGAGGAYGIYRYRVDRINEKILFLENLAEKNRQLQEASRRLAITEERNRMGRELHDSISQGIHGIIFSIHSLKNELKHSTPRVNEIISHIETTANYTLDELRAMIEELKPSLVVEKGLIEALKILTDLYSQRQEIPIKLHIDLQKEIPPDMEMIIYRICQESLTNIEKYAKASHVELSLINTGNTIILNIKDDGVGFNQKDIKVGNGLKNIKIRAEDVGGTVDIISKVGTGSHIKVYFPPKD